MQPNQKTIPLDQDVVAFSKAMMQHESGNNFTAKGQSGEYGVAQWQKPTWEAEAQKYLGYVPKWGTAEMTPDVQKAVLYSKINDLKQQGLNPAQIAAQHNSGTSTNWENKIDVNSYGVKYNVPEYVKSVTDLYHQIKSQQTPDVQTQPVLPIEQPSQTGAMFPSSPTDTPIEAGLKTAGNFIPSAWNFAKGLVNTINPINTVKNLKQIPSEVMGLIGDKGTFGQKLGNLAQGAYESLVPEAGRALVTGDLATAQKAITEDPVGQIAPFLLAAEGGAKAIDTKFGTKLAPAMDTAITKTAQTVTKPASAVTGGLTNILGGVTKSAASHITGLDASTVSKIIESPEAFSRLKQDQISRGGLANEFGQAIDSLEGKLQETGAGYEPIRANKGIVVAPENFIKDTLDKFGLKLNEMNKIVADTTSATRNTSDINALQKFVDDWGQKQQLTPQEFLNMRSDLADLAKYDKLTGMGKTKVSETIAQSMREEANRTIRPQIPGLKELDAEYAPRIQQFNQIKKDFLTKDSNGEYVFKDNAVSKIANAANKDNLIARMEEVLPGIKKKIEILKAVEDIQKASENKIGAYTKGALGAFAIATLSPSAVVAAIVTNPAIAVPLIRGLGWSKVKIAPVVSSLKMIAGDINHLKVPSRVTPLTNQPNVSK